MDSSIISNGSNSKSRREMFEEQLKELQSDISNLSHKLSVPSLVTTHRMNSLRSTSTSAATGTTAATTTTSLSATTSSAANETATLQDRNRSFLSSANSHSAQNILAMPSSAQLSAQDLHFQQSRFDMLASELKDTLRQRDDALRLVEQLRSENDELRRKLADHAETKNAYESLRKDFDSVKLSLESCERIRLQQKELIEVLQRSQAMLGVSATAGIGASLTMANDEHGSVHSYNSLSSISHTANTANTAQMIPSTQIHANTRPRRGSHSSQGSVRSADSAGRGDLSRERGSPGQEHRDWLNVTFQSGPPPEKARSRSAGRPPRASTSSPSAVSPSATTRRRSVTPTPSTVASRSREQQQQVTVSGFVPQYSSSSSAPVNMHMHMQANPNNPHGNSNSHVGAVYNGVNTSSGVPVHHDSFLSANHSMISHASQLYPHLSSSSPSFAHTQPSPYAQASLVPFHAQPHMQPQTSGGVSSDPHHTSSLLTSLLLNQSPVRVNTSPAGAPQTSKKPSSSSANAKKKLTRRTTSAPPTGSKSSVAASAAKHNTHITPSSSSQLNRSSSSVKKKTKKKMSSSSSREPLVHEGTGVRILYRPVPSPVSTFGKAKRM